LILNRTFLREERSLRGYQMVIRYILHYLIEHPDAKDTIQGIPRWWLPGHIEEWEEGVVQEALDVLVAKGWLTQRQTTTSQTLYGMNKERLEEIKAFLREREREVGEERE
jgi:hypothetical protein